MALIIDFTALVITPEIEALIRDNVVNPESGLDEQALKVLTQRYAIDSYDRAKMQYAASAQEKEPGLPIYTDQTAMIAWFAARGGYQNATEIYISNETGRIGDLINLLTEERDGTQTRLEALVEGSQSFVSDTNVLSIRITALDEEIAALETELAELTAS